MQRQSYIKISSLYIAHHYHAGQSQQEAVTSPTVHRDRRDDVHADQSAGMEESQLPYIHVALIMILYKFLIPMSSISSML